MRRFVAAPAVLAVSLTLAAGAAAQSYPSRPITMIVPLASGGSTDVIARIMAEGMRAALGQPIIVENVTGAGGTIGVGRVARSAPDGYTIGIGQWGTNVAQRRDLSAPVRPVEGFRAHCADRDPAVPDRRQENGAGERSHGTDRLVEGERGQGLAGQLRRGYPQPRRRHLLQNAIGARFQMVPYRSAGLSMQDLVAGQIDVMLDTPAVSLPQVRSGNIKAYAVTAKNRLAAAPDIPTTDEAGLPGFYFSFWHALWVPKGTPKEIIDKLNGAVVSSLADPGIRQEARRSLAGDFSARAADAGGARRLPEGRDREVVADHQGGRHQGAMNPGTRPRAPGGKCQPGASIRCSKPSTMAWNFSHGASRSL